MLPEAFNLGRPYGEGPGSTICHSSIKTGLTKLAKDCSITFVVSLLVPGDKERPYNIAYSIDGSNVREICRKSLPDGYGCYVVCNQDCDHENPVSNWDANMQQTAVGALICVDADSERLKDLRRSLHHHRKLLASLPPSVTNQGLRAGGLDIESGRMLRTPKSPWQTPEMGIGVS